MLKVNIYVQKSFAGKFSKFLQLNRQMVIKSRSGFHSAAINVLK